MKAGRSKYIIRNKINTTGCITVQNVKRKKKEGENQIFIYIHYFM